MHSLASSSNRPSGEGTIAAVGQASMQRVQVPQRSGGGASGSRSSVVSSSPRKNHDPSFWLIRQVFLPIHPSPACLRQRTLQQAARYRRRLAIRNCSISSSLRAKFFKFCAKDIMVVFAPGVSGDPGALRIGELCRIGLGTVVNQPHADDRSHARQQLLPDRPEYPRGGRSGSAFRRPGRDPPNRGIGQNRVPGSAPRTPASSKPAFCR